MTEKNIFENAKFGDRFKTNGYGDAIYHEYYPPCNIHQLLIENYGLVYFNPDGTNYGDTGVDYINIVSRYEEQVGETPNEKSIEERALEFAINKPQSHGRLQGYIKGATEQRQIDIDKACEWLRENMNIHQTSFSLTTPPSPGKFINAEEAFHNAMEK